MTITVENNYLVFHEMLDIENMKHGKNLFFSTLFPFIEHWKYQKIEDRYLFYYRETI